MKKYRTYLPGNPADTNLIMPKWSITTKELRQSTWKDKKQNNLSVTPHLRLGPPEPLNLNH